MAAVERTDLPWQRLGQRLNYKENTLTTCSQKKKKKMAALLVVMGFL